MQLLKKLAEIRLLIVCFWVVGWRSLVVILLANTNKMSQSFVDRYIREGAHIVLRLFNARYQITFTKPLERKLGTIYVFMSNHQSLLDLPLIFATVPYSLRVIAKQFLFDIPLFGKAMELVGYIPVDTSDPQKTITKMAQRLHDLQQGAFLWVFPEGTRSTTNTLLPLKPGIFRLARELNAKIIPVGITGTGEALPANTFKAKLGQTLQIKIGEEIDTANYPDLASQKVLMDKVAQAISHLMNIK